MVWLIVGIVGILISVFITKITLILLSGALYGSTFIGLVALFLNLGDQLAEKNLVVLMGSMTAAYGIGQVAAPLYSIALIDYFGNYNATLCLTALIVLIGISLLLCIKRMAR